MRGSPPLLGATCILSLVAALGPRAHGGGAPITLAMSAGTSQMAPASQPARTDLSRVQLGFEVNRGQAQPGTRFLAHIGAMTVAFTDHGLVLGPGSVTDPETRLHITPIGGAARQNILALDQLPGTVNYFIGNDPARWRTDIPTYGEILYRNVYPGIDLRFRGQGGSLEYDWLLRPHADPADIRLQVSGSARLRLDRAGRLLLGTGAGGVFQRAPVIYQLAGGHRQLMRGGFRVLRGNQICVWLGAYDHSLPIVIDPLLQALTYFGGDGGDETHGVGVDGAGNIYLAASSDSSNLPALDAYQGFNRGSSDFVVVKMNSSLTQLLYSTYIGGSDTDTVSGLAVDTAGNAYVTGATLSSDFPRFLGTPSTSTSNVVVLKLDSTGDMLLYSSILTDLLRVGSVVQVTSYAITVDSRGVAYVAGEIHTTANGTDCLLVKLNVSGQVAAWNSYGGSEDDRAAAVALTGHGQVVIAGITASPDFPAVFAEQQLYHGNDDAFMMELDVTTLSIDVSTYLGGTSVDQAYGVAVDELGDIVVAGFTMSPDFPSLPKRSPPGAGNAFVVKYAPDAHTLLYSVQVGGSDSDTGLALAVDANGDAYVAGQTSSNDLPMVNPISGQGAFHGGMCTVPMGQPFICRDGFVVRLEQDGSGLTYSTYLGGTGDDLIDELALDSAGDLLVAGTTDSADLPVSAGAVDGALSTPRDTFLANLGNPPESPPPTATPTNTPTSTATATSTAVLTLTASAGGTNTPAPTATPTATTVVQPTAPPTASTGPTLVPTAIPTPTLVTRLQAPVIVLRRHSVVSGGVLTGTIETLAFARVVATLEVDQTLQARARIAYRVIKRGHADVRGEYVFRFRVTYGLPHQVVTARLTVTVTAHGHTRSRSTSIAILPRP